MFRQLSRITIAQHGNENVLDIGKEILDVSPSRAKERSIPRESGPQETSWFSNPFGASHESVCTKFQA